MGWDARPRLSSVLPNASLAGFHQLRFFINSGGPLAHGFSG